MLGIQGLNGRSCDELFNLIRENHDLCLGRIKAIQCDLLLLCHEFLFKHDYHIVAVLLFSGRGKGIVGLQVIDLLL